MVTIDKQTAKVIFNKIEELIEDNRSYSPVTIEQSKFYHKLKELRKEYLGE